MKIIGINATHTPKSMGGVYQYQVKFIRALVEADKENKYIIFHDDDSIFHESFDNRLIQFIKVPINFLERLVLKYRGHSTFRAVAQTHFTYFMNKVFNRFKIDLLLQPNHHNAYKVSVPYIVSIQDAPIQYSQACKENMTKKRLIVRNYLLKKITAKAEKILVDTHYSKETISKYYNIKPNNITVLPFRTPDYINSNIDNEQVEKILNVYNLPELYIYYPSGISKWKNHLGLLKAIKKINKNKRFNLSLVLTGAKADAWELVDKYIKENQLTKNVFYLGYVPDDHISAIYKKAAVMVMPTFLGPSNLPVLEAFTMKCPVIVSNLPGYDEQVENAGILVNPENTEEIIEAICGVLTNQSLRNTLVKNGCQRIKSLERSSYGEEILKIVNETLER